MVIDDFHVMGFGVFPAEAEPVLIVDSDAVLAHAFPGHRFQRIAGRPEVIQAPRRMQLEELPNGGLFDGLKLARPNAFEDLLRFGASKRANHRLIVYR
jgi:hypothetical protein